MANKKIALGLKDLKDNGLVSVTINLEENAGRETTYSPFYPGKSRFICHYSQALKIIEGTGIGNPHLPFSNLTTLTPGQNIEYVLDEILEYKRKHNESLCQTNSSPRF